MKPIHSIYIKKQTVPVKLADAFVCGGVTDAFQYEAWISGRGLDSNGFLSEVKGLLESVKYAFDKWETQYGGCNEPESGATLKASCEELCNGVANALYYKAAGLTEVTTIKVKVWNLTGFITLEWNQGEDLPSFPRKATKAELKADVPKAERYAARSSC